MITAMSLTNGTLTLVVDASRILTARNDHPKWKEIVEAFKTGNDTRLEALISLKAVVETYSVGEVSVNSTGVTYRGQPMHNVDADRVMAFLRDGLPYKPIANYMARKMANPSARAIRELYSFLEHKNMPITPEGKIIAYKGVNMDFYSVHGNTETVVLKGTVDGKGRILNEVGAVVEVERSSVDDDFRNGCSFGLHAGSLSYARGWGQRVILVEIDPADVVSVPSDCSCQKLRCCKYKVIGEYTGAMPEHYTDEFSETEPEQTTAEPYIPVSPDNSVRDEMETRIKEMVHEQTGVSFDAIAADSRYVEDLGFDSLDGVELVMALEAEYKIEIGDNDAEELGNKPFSALVDYIYSRVNATSDVTSAHLQGRQDGIRDRSAGKPSKFLKGDETGADSKEHANYIVGYVEGYA